MTPQSADSLDEESSAAVAWLLDRAGSYLYIQGRPADAIPLMRRAVSLHERFSWGRATEEASLLNGLGLALTDMGESMEAVQVLERALHILEADGQAQAEVANVLGHLGWALAQQDPQRACPVYERAVEICELLHGCSDYRVASALNGLGRVLTDLGEAEAAAALHRRALDICEAHYGSSHPWIGTTLNYLGSALRALGKPDQAYTLHLRALEIREEAYGPNHPWVANTLHGLGQSLTDLGSAARAIPLHERAIEINTVTYGLNHMRAKTGHSYPERARTAIVHIQDAEEKAAGGKVE